MSQKVYLVYEIDGTSMSAIPRLQCVVTSKKKAKALVEAWEPARFWSSLSISETTLMENPVITERGKIVDKEQKA